MWHTLQTFVSFVLQKSIAILVLYKKFFFGESTFCSFCSQPQMIQNMCWVSNSSNYKLHSAFFGAFSFFGAPGDPSLTIFNFKPSLTAQTTVFLRPPSLSLLTGGEDKFNFLKKRSRRRRETTQGECPHTHTFLPSQLTHTHTLLAWLASTSTHTFVLLQLRSHSHSLFYWREKNFFHS